MSLHFRRRPSAHNETESKQLRLELDALRLEPGARLSHGLHTAALSPFRLRKAPNLLAMAEYFVSEQLQAVAAARGESCSKMRARLLQVARKLTLATACSGTDSPVAPGS